MDDIRFDALARCLGSRRSLLAGVAVALSAAPVSVAARKGRKKKDKKPKKCQPGFTRCAGSTGKSTCVELQTDTTHCGACGKACPSDQTCVAGVCTPRCPQCGSGEGCCGRECVDLANDPNHCGSCERKCGAKETCLNGACFCVPATCADLGKTCGTFDDGCGGTRNCGICIETFPCPTCPPDPPSCTPLTCLILDRACGVVADGCGGTLDCGNPCDTNVQCISGRCVEPTCGPGIVLNCYPH